jgi:hypothetical protein
MRTLRDRTWAHTDEEEFKERLIQSFPKAEILKFKNLIQEVIDRLEINPLLTSSQGKDLTQMEEEYTVNDFFRIIGKISVCFAALDMFTSQLLRDLTKREPSSELPFPVNATLGRKLHLLKDMNPEDTINLDVLTEFKNFLPEALKIADERNRYIHDMWIFDRSLPSGRMRRVQMTYQGIEDGDTVLSIEDLNRF